LNLFLFYRWERRQGKNPINVKTTPPKSLQNVASKYKSPSSSSPQTRVDKVLHGKKKLEKEIDSIMKSKCTITDISSNSHLLIPTESVKRQSRKSESDACTESDDTTEDNLIKIHELFMLMDTNANGTIYLFIYLSIYLSY
jgi:hypothetical protein